MTVRGRRLLLICGSLRNGSSNEALLRTAAAQLPPDVAADVYDGMARLPLFIPDDDHDPLPDAVIDLRARVESADAILFSTPEYAGAMPGALKNLLEWTVGGTETTDKPAAWINISAAPGGASKTHESLTTVLTYTGAKVIEDACVRIPIQRDAIGASGEIDDPALREQIAAAVERLLSQIRSQ